MHVHLLQHKILTITIIPLRLSCAHSDVKLSSRNFITNAGHLGTNLLKHCKQTKHRHAILLNLINLETAVSVLYFKTAFNDIKS